MKIAISGTYSTGKTTLTEALSLITGIPRTQARTMREILPDAIPGKILEQCTPAELLNLGMTRLVERAINEERIGDNYFSDGSCLHEWVYGAARLSIGINPSENRIKLLIKNTITYPALSIYQKYIESFGSVVKRHAKKTYSMFVHLPIEFPIMEDGHRPVSEQFRQKSDSLLIETLNELEIPYIEVKGNLHQRIEQIIDYFNFPVIMDIDQSIDKAREKIAREAIKIEQYRETILSKK